MLDAAAERRLASQSNITSATAAAKRRLCLNVRAREISRIHGDSAIR